MLNNPNAMILMTDFEKAEGGQGGGGDQKWFLELPQAEARQLKIRNGLLFEMLGGGLYWREHGNRISLNNILP